MNEVKICYTQAANAGDAINPLIVEKIMGYKAICTNQFQCQISGIGSGLRRFFVDPNGKNGEALEYIKHREIVREKPIILWSAGFIEKTKGCEIPISRNLRVSSVRGKISKKYVEEIMRKKIDCVVGDGGLLVSLLLKEPIHKKYKLGIIPHRREKNEPVYKKIAEEIYKSIIIDIEAEDVMECVQKISECECIISSSLHGLIFADSFCIPNRHVILTDRLTGDGTKFRDHYSIFDMEDVYQDLNQKSEICINEIIDSYQISRDMIEEKQEEIIEAFHKYL